MEWITETYAPTTTTEEWGTETYAPTTTTSEPQVEEYCKCNLISIFSTVKAAQDVRMFMFP